MTPAKFAKTYWGEAVKSQSKTGVPALSSMAQAALESAWGEVAPGNMLFGIKDTDGVNGNEQLITTTEYSTRANLKFPVVLSITPVIRKGRKMFKYRVKDYFRKYATPEESFTDHGKFFLENPRYKKALAVAHDPLLFIDEVAKAGYATDPDYAEVLRKLVKMIQPFCK